MTPTPTPAPPMTMHAMPATISFAAAGSIFSSLRKERRREGGNSRDRILSRLNSVVEIDSGEDREHVGLQERDQQFALKVFAGFVAMLGASLGAMWPASMLANRRTLCETGRRKNDRISMNMTSGRM